MATSVTLALLAAGVFLLWFGLTGAPVVATLRSVVTTGKTPPKPPAQP